MAGAQGSALAVAVSEFGRAGLAAVRDARPADAMRGELESIAAQTEQALQRELLLPHAPEADAGREAAWRAALTPYYEKYGIDPAEHRRRARTCSIQRRARRRARVNSSRPWSVSISVCRRGICWRGWQSWRAKVIRLGDDGRRSPVARSARGRCDHRAGRGGRRTPRHVPVGRPERPRSARSRCLPQIVHAVKLPVVAAGGIADAQGVAAAMALGAAGVQIGTAYLLCPEATTSAVHRAALKSEAARHTALTNLFHGPRRPRNRESPDAGARPDERRRAGVSPRHPGHRALARQSRGRRLGVIFSAVVRPECRRMQGSAGGAAHAGTGGRPVVDLNGKRFGLQASSGSVTASPTVIVPPGPGAGTRQRSVRSARIP